MNMHLHADESVSPLARHELWRPGWDAVPLERISSLLSVIQIVVDSGIGYQ